MPTCPTQPIYRRRAAFSLLELLAVVVILGILAAMVVPRVAVTTTTARENVHSHNLETINEAVEHFSLMNGRLPNDISEIDTVNYFPDGLPTNPVDGQPYALDPTTKRAVDSSGS